MPSIQQQLINLWESTQVELHGNYSTNRLVTLAQFTRETSWLCVVVILVVTPLPCLVVTVLVDSLPLADPSEGLHANHLFFVRAFYTYIVITLCATNQFRFSVPDLPYPLLKAILNTIVVSAVCTGIMYALDVAIGFPLPFSLLTTTPPWVTLIGITLAIEWVKKNPVTPGSGEMLLNTIKLWMCQVLMVCVYPPYYYIFTTLSGTGQAMFSMLLPGIKLALRNIFARTNVHLSDEVPFVIAFNIEIFNSLFVSYCMQNSPSIGTTLTVTAALLVQLVLSLRDVHVAAKERSN